MKKFSGWLSVILAFFVGAAHAGSVYTEDQRKITVTEKDPAFSLKLKSNATTGYSWSVLKLDKKVVKVVSHKYVRPDSRLIGAGGYEVWNFKVLPGVKGKATVIEMRYARPWEREVNGSVLVFDVDIES